MKFASVLTDEADIGKAAAEIGRSIQRQLEDRTADLALVFCSSHYAGYAEDLLAGIRDTLSPGVLVGCTGEGVIGPDHEVEGRAAVAVVAAHMPDVALRPFMLSPDQIGLIAEDSKELPYALRARQDTKAFLLVGDPFSAYIDGLLKAFNAKYSDVPVVGGMASGGRSPGENVLFLDDKTYRNGAVGVALAGPVAVDTIVSQGCRPIGPLLTVTSSDANLIKQLDDKPAMVQIQGLIEELPEEDKTLLSNGLFVGRAIDSSKELFGRGDFLVRGVVGIDRKTGAIAVGDFVEKGEAVQFHLRDADTAKEDLELMLTPHSLFGAPAGALLFSCNGRGTRLYDHPDGDISAINSFFEGIPVAGFFCAGEFGPVGGKNFLHGHTASLVLIRPATPTVPGAQA
jgi:small ligand-binding sensory domain FIST